MKYMFEIPRVSSKFNYPHRFRNFRIKDQSLYSAYCIWGWGGPAFLLITTLTMHYREGHHLKPGFGDYNCWFGGKLYRNNPLFSSTTKIDYRLHTECTSMV